MQRNSFFIAILLLFAFLRGGSLYAKDVQVKTIDELAEMHAEAQSLDPEQRAIEARLKIVRAGAIATATPHAFITEMRKQQARLQAVENELDAIFPFQDVQKMAVDQLSNADEIKTLSFVFIPPAIAEYQRATMSSPKSDVLRIASSEYVFVQPARLATAPLDWRDLLLTFDFAEPPKPNPGVLPRNKMEQEVWRQGIAEGWAAGIEQARFEMKTRLIRAARLLRGMIKYVYLVEQRMIEPPIVALTRSPVELNAPEREMAVDVWRYRIVVRPRFNGNVSAWRAVWSGEIEARGRVRSYEHNKQ